MSPPLCSFPVLHLHPYHQAGAGASCSRAEIQTSHCAPPFGCLTVCARVLAGLSACLGGCGAKPQSLGVMLGGSGDACSRKGRKLGEGRYQLWVGGLVGSGRGGHFACSHVASVQNVERGNVSIWDPESVQTCVHRPGRTRGSPPPELSV